MNNALNGRMTYTGLRSSLKEAVIILASEANEIVRLGHDVNGFYVSSRELGTLGDSQIVRIQIMFTINTLSIDFMDGSAYSRLWCDKIQNFETLMRYAEGFSGAHAFRGVKKIGSALFRVG